MRSSTSAALPHLHAGVLATGIAAVAYTLAPFVTRAFTADAIALAKSLLLAPIVEELFFRGVLHSGLRARGGFWGGPWSALVLTSLCFGAAHLVGNSAVHAALAVAPACVIGWAYERTRSIALCVAMHSTANAFWIGFWRW